MTNRSQAGYDPEQDAIWLSIIISAAVCVYCLAWLIIFGGSHV
tara:strand:+ start:695 stop:823 length:129 start_codon:yes stop_codon:yes gene_type:complete